MKEFGFVESKKKDLFYKRMNEKVILFFDFRSNWMSDNCKFYFKILGEEKYIYNQEIINEFFKVAKKLKIAIDFDSLGGCLNCDKKVCVGLFCSEFCFKKIQREEIKEDEEIKVMEIFDNYNKSVELKCEVCGEKPEFDGYKLEEVIRANHHTDYREGKEKTIKVCTPCHTKITFHLDKYPELKIYEPLGTRKEMLERKKIRIIKKEKIVSKRNILLPTFYVESYKSPLLKWGQIIQERSNANPIKAIEGARDIF